MKIEKFIKQLRELEEYQKHMKNSFKLKIICSDEKVHKILFDGKNVSDKAYALILLDLK